MKYFYFFTFFYINSHGDHKTVISCKDYIVVNSDEDDAFFKKDENLMFFSYKKDTGFFDEIGEKAYFFACKYLCCFS